MVLADRNAETIRNGRRSRGPSPNGHASETSTDDENAGRVPEEKIRVGRDYQCLVPPLIPKEDRRPEEQCIERALLVWSPSNNIPDPKLDEYITLSKEKFGYNGEQALGMLFWHKHDLERAVLDLANFTPFPDEWTVEDKVLFEQAFQFHGKSFHRIRQMTGWEGSLCVVGGEVSRFAQLPDKSIACLVKYYYSWKKTRSRTSLMDRQARRAAAQKEDGSEGGSELGSNTDSDSDEKKWTIHRGIRRKSGSPPRVSTEEQKDGEGGRCSNCNINCSVLYSSPKGGMCQTCHSHYKRTNTLRPTIGPVRREGRNLSLLRHKRKPPRGMYINHEDLLTIGSGPAGQGEAMLTGMDREIISLKRQVQINKQNISALKKRNKESLGDMKPADTTSRINARWTHDELLLAVQGIRKYGKDFRAIAEVLGTKTEAHLRAYFVNYRRRFNLDVVLREFEAENGPVPAEEDDKMEVDVSSGSEAGTPAPASPKQNKAAPPQPPPQQQLTPVK